MIFEDDQEIPQRLLKKKEIKRDEVGRFEQHGTGLIKKSQKIKPANIAGKLKHGGHRTGAGRPKGSKNKITLALKEAILSALDKLGGDQYLVTLGIENSSAFAGLLGKVLPTTLSTPETDGGGAKLEFVRVIVYPDGHRHVEGVTPLQLPAPEVSHALPSDDKVEVEDKENKDLE